MVKKILISGLAALVIFGAFGLTACGSNGSLAVKPGVYISDGGFASVSLLDGNKYIFVRHIGTDYCPSGDYSILNGRLIFYIENKEEFIFDIQDGQLVFVSGHLAEPFVEVGTIFKLSD